MKIKTIVIAIVALAVVAVAGTRLFNENKTNDQSDVVKPLESIKVSVVKPTVMQFEDIVTFVGGVEPKEAAIVASKVTSNVTVLDVFVDIGDQVKQGQLLARLDDSLTRRQIEEARAAVAAAKASISQAK
ncbi:MAG TPA: biotin/lipoyl-binding protein, partial [Acetomicrobium flavidum]|nr:biotin/lipoyl-binding protein [Acetomicrobium flavidum]